MPKISQGHIARARAIVLLRSVGLEAARTTGSKANRYSLVVGGNPLTIVAQCANWFTDDVLDAVTALEPDASGKVYLRLTADRNGNLVGVRALPGRPAALDAKVVEEEETPV